MWVLCQNQASTFWERWLSFELNFLRGWWWVGMVLWKDELFSHCLPDSFVCFILQSSINTWMHIWWKHISFNYDKSASWYTLILNGKNKYGISHYLIVKSATGSFNLNNQIYRFFLFSLWIVKYICLQLAPNCYYKSSFYFF